MPITIGNITSVGLNASPGLGLSVTTHNHNGDFLLVDIAEGYIAAGSVTGATWNGVAMTFLGSVSLPSSSRTVYQYGLAGADTGTHTLTVAWAGNDDIGARITLRSFSGVNQSTPVGTTVTNTAVAGTSISVNASSAANEIVADSVLTRLSTATLTPSAPVAITEHGIFSQAATGGGVLLDRSVFSVVNLASGDSLQATYDLTFAAGG